MKKIYVIGICALIALIGIVIVANEIASGGSVTRAIADKNYQAPDYSKQRWDISPSDPMMYDRGLSFPLLVGATLVSILSASAGAFLWKKGDDTHT